MPIDVTNAGLPKPQPAGGSSVGTYSSALLVEELDAPAGKQPRTVTLQGPGLPFQGANWGFTNTLPTKWYPGNGDEATQQVLGPQEMPSSWQGEWCRTMMGLAPSLATDENGLRITVVDPDMLFTLLEGIFRGGARLRVTWSQTSDNPSSRGKKIREGRCASFNGKYTRFQDVAWEASFTWQSRGARVQTVTATRDGSADAASAALSLAMTDLASQIAAAPFIASNAAIYKSASTITLGQLEAIANTPARIANRLQQSILQLQHKLQSVVAIAQTLASQPQQVVGAAVNTARNAVAVANQFVDQQGQTPPETLTTKSNVHDLLRSFRYFGQTSDAARASANAAQQLAAQLQARAPTPAGAGTLNPQSASSQNGDMLAVYVTKDGDTPARLSARFYGGAMDHGVDILQANRLPWYQPTFPTGKVLFIPRLKAQQRTV